MDANTKAKLPENITSEIVEGMRSILGEKLQSVVLYGSVARGDDGPESDVDIALFVREPMTRELIQQVNSYMTDINWNYDRFLSVIDIDQSKYERWIGVLPFYQNIEKDGIVLWKASQAATDEDNNP